MESWKRTLYVSWGVLFFQSLAMGMLMPFLPLYIKDLGVTDPRAQATWSGIIYGVTYVVTALLGPYWGTLSDKYGRKPLILRTSFGVSFIALLMFFATNVYQLLALRILHGFCGAMLPSFVALVSQEMPAKKTGQGLGTMLAAQMAGSILGPFVGGVSSDWMGYRNVLLIIAVVTLIASVLTMVFIREEKRDRTKTQFTTLENIKLILRSENLRVVSLVIFLIQFAIFIVQPLLPLFIVSLPGDGNTSTMVGLIFSITAVSTMLFSPYWGKEGDRKGHKAVLFKCLLFSGFVYFFQALVTSAYQLMLLRALIGFFVAGIIPATQALIVMDTKDAQRGGILGTIYSVNFLGQALGPFLGGIMGAFFGYKIPFVMTSVLLIGISYVFRDYFRKSERSV